MAGNPIVDSDKVQFEPNFAATIVVVKPGTISGTGKSTAGGKKLCLVGDEKNVKVPGCLYNNPPFLNGTGTLKIGPLLPDQQSLKTSDSGEKIILKGNYFIAIFKVDAPAINPANGQTDPVPSFIGKGKFINSVTKITIA